MDPLNPSSNFLKSDPSTPSKQPFKVFRRAKKEVWNNHELQILVKKHIKDFQSLECHQTPIDLSSWEDPSPIDRNKLRSLTKILRASKSPALLKFPLQSPGSFNLNSFLPHLKHHLNALSTFKLDFAHYAFMTSNDVKSLMLYLKKLKKLSNLDCRLYDVILDPNEALPTFRSLTFLRCLSTISVNFNYMEMLSDQSLKLFSSHLTNLPSLTSLSIDLSYCNGISSTGFSYLFSSFSKLTHLESLKFDAKGFPNLQYSIRIDLFQSLKDLPHFQDLNLSLSGCISPERNPQSPILPGLALLDPSRIKKLSLAIYSDFSDPELAELLVILQRFSGLTHLGLLFDQGCYMKGDGFKDFPKAIACFPNLAHLHLKLSQRIDPKTVFNALSLCFEQLKKLISLKINSEGHLSAEASAIQKFCKRLSCLSKLKYLHFNFSLCHYWNDKCVETLASGLKGHPNLIELHLNFGSLDKISNQGIGALARSLENLKGIRKLELLFRYCMKIDCKSFEIITDCLKSLNELEEINLTMMPMSHMNFIEEYRNLISVLEKIEKLRKASLQLSKTEDGTDCDLLVERVKKTFKNITINWQ